MLPQFAGKDRNESHPQPQVWPSLCWGDWVFPDSHVPYLLSFLPNVFLTRSAQLPLNWLLSFN